MITASICIALLGLLVFGLGLVVSLNRRSTKRSIGHDADPTDALHKACRAHANAAEYNPMLAVLIYVIATRDPSGWMVWTFVAATLCRYLHAAGMIFPASLAQPNPLRFVGALGTYITGLALVVAVLVV
jgi:uncharacterized membrane protein YecN with MAPEG domain